MSDEVEEIATILSRTISAAGSEQHADLLSLAMQKVRMMSARVEELEESVRFEQDMNATWQTRALTAEARVGERGGTTYTLCRDSLGVMWVLDSNGKAFGSVNELDQRGEEKPSGDIEKK